MTLQLKNLNPGQMLVQPIEMPLGAHVTVPGFESCLYSQLQLLLL